jgi:hypothetical protein
MLLVAALATALAVGCTTAPAGPAHQPGSSAPADQPSATAVAASISKVQACRQLRDDMARHHGRSAVPGLRQIADHVTDPRMAGDARTAVRDIDHTGVAPVALTLLRDDCRRAGVRIPAP